MDGRHEARSLCAIGYVGDDEQAAAGIHHTDPNLVRAADALLPVGSNFLECVLCQFSRGHPGQFIETCRPPRWEL